MENVKLGDVFSFIRNGANIKQGLDDSGYPITRIETISERTVNRKKMGYAGITDISKYDDYILQDGDILMSHINSEKHLGKTAIYKKQKDEKIIHGMNLLCLRPDNSQILPEYAFYFLSSNDFLRQIPNITKKSVNQASFTVTALKELSFAKCNIDEQKKIIDELDKVTDLIDKRKEQLSKLDELVKARFVELFGDPLDEDLANEYFTNCVEFNPKKSEIKDLQDIEVSFVPMECVGTDGSFSVKETGKVSDYYKGYTYFRDGDVLLAKITPCFENGKVAIAENCKNGIGFGTTEFHVSRPISGVSNSHWIKYLLKNREVHRLATINMTGSAGQKRIQTPFFDRLRIYLPPIELQNQFASFVEQTDKSKLEVQKSLEKLELLKKALMQKYFG